MKIITLVCVVVFVSYVSGQIDKPCQQDNECDTSNKYQCIQNKCRCKTGYRKLPNVPSCTLVPGTSCENNNDCENFPGAECDANKKCICEGGYTAGKTECDNVGLKGDTCNSHAICVRRLQDDNTECKDDFCVCKEGFHKGINLKCTRSAGLEDQCSNNNDCYLIVKDQNALECSGDGICRCRDPFKQVGDTCDGSAALYSAPLMIALIMGILKLM